MKQIFFYYLGFLFYKHSRMTGLQGKEEGISLTPHYHFHPPHGSLDNGWPIAAGNSTLHIAIKLTRTSNLDFGAQIANY